MPRIHDVLLNCVLYLYPTTEDAKEGRREGGAGFWAGVESEVVSDMWHTYVVTNGHVIRKSQGSSLVLRINRRGGGFDIIETEESGWIYHPDGDDIAVYPLNPPRVLELTYVPTSLFANHSLIEKYDIGPGNDVFMVSRFISHSGKQVNTPALRFGNISMMPIEPILNPISGINQESFLVECRSLSGSSGSPVFVQFSIHDRFRGMTLDEKKSPLLLGIVWGHLNLIDPDFEYVRDAAGDILDEKLRVRINTGMMQVVPAWKIQEILDLPELRERRTKEYEEFVQSRAGMLAILDAQGLPDEIKKQIVPDLNYKKNDQQQD